MSELTRDGTVEPVSRDQIFRCEREQEKVRTLFQLKILVQIRVDARKLPYLLV